MPTFKVNVIAVKGPLQYLDHEVEANSPDEAAKMVRDWLDNPTTSLSWSTAGHSLEFNGQETDQGAFIAGVKKLKADGSVDTSEPDDKPSVPVKTNQQGPVTMAAADGSVVVPSNGPVGGRFSRNTAPLVKGEVDQATGMGPAKARPGDYPRNGQAAATGVFTPGPNGDHLPISQRSQAVAEPGRRMGDGSKPATTDLVKNTLEGQKTHQGGKRDPGDMSTVQSGSGEKAGGHDRADTGKAHMGDMPTAQTPPEVAAA